MALKLALIGIQMNNVHPLGINTPSRNHGDILTPILP